MRKMVAPTASEKTRVEARSVGRGISAQTEPQKRPMRCPPITLLGAAAMLLGMVKTMKAVAPIEAMTTAFCALSRKRTAKTTAVAMKLW
jgi:hypothetical protein